MAARGGAFVLQGCVERVLLAGIGICEQADGEAEQDKADKQKKADNMPGGDDKGCCGNDAEDSCAQFCGQCARDSAGQADFHGSGSYGGGGGSGFG